jgi:ribonuclease E
MSKEMLINVSEGEECRIALVENGRLEELYMERTSATSHVGNIYKGRVTNVEPSIQAAFIDFGLGRNGFLHISDLMPQYFGRDGSDYQETVGRKMARRDRPPIQRCLRRGDEIIVQIIKEGIGTKGPTLSSYISIPGKMLVMMPGMGKMGVSKKIEDDAERRRLRTILDSLKPPKGVAFIIRTAGIGKSKTEIERDLKYLTRVWEQIEKKQQEPAPVELYTEGDLVARTVRDVFTSDVDRIVVDNKDVAKRVKDVIKISAPRTKNKVDVYEDPVPLFHQFGIEKDIELMYSRHVPLPSGGSLVIDSTEAIVAIDVNSGKNRESGDAETTAFRVDMEAADEICRQLKLRDLGGVIICDFIDLRYERHRRELEKRLDDNFKRDRAKTKVLRMSQFGIIEMTRQRMRPSLKRSVYFDCPHCKGAGLVKTPESMALDVMRKLAIAANDLRVARVEMAACPDVAFSLLNKKRRALAELEESTGKKITIKSDVSLGLDELKLSLFDARDGMVILEELGMTLVQPGHVTQLGRRGGGRHDNRGAGGRRDDRNRQGGGGGGQRGGQRGGGRQVADEDDEDEDARFARETAEEAQGRDRGGDEEPDAEPQQGTGAEARESDSDAVEIRDDRSGRPDRGGRGRRPSAPRHVDVDADADIADDEESEFAGTTDESSTGEYAGDDSEVAPGEEGDFATPQADRGAAGGQGTGEPRSQDEEGGGGRRRRRRRRGRRGRGGANGENAPAVTGQGEGANPPQPQQPQGNRSGGGNRDNRDNRAPAGHRDNRGGGGGRYDSPNAAYNQGRRADGSFENVTELETVDFGEDDNHPQPISNESPRLRDKLRLERRHEQQKARSGQQPNRRDERGGGQPTRGGSQPSQGANRGGGGPQNRGGGGGGGSQGGRREQPVRIPPPRPVDESSPVSRDYDDTADDFDESTAGAQGGGAGGAGTIPGQPPLAEGEQPRKRRRRRGGRRHRRRRENQMSREQGDDTTPGALPPPSPNDGGETIASADAGDYDDYESDDDAREDVGGAAEGIIEAEPVAKAPSVEPEPVDEPVSEPARAPAKRARRTSKPVAAAPAQDPASSTSKSSRVRRKSPPPAPLPVVKTGSTDKHLVPEEPADAVESEIDTTEEITDVEAVTPPTRRRGASRKPSSYSDLDAIPDDYD